MTTISPHNRPDRLVVHATDTAAMLGRHEAPANEKHAHWQQKLVGEHFQEVEIRVDGGMPAEALFRDGYWFTRLRAGGRIIFQTRAVPV